MRADRTSTQPHLLVVRTTVRIEWNENENWREQAKKYTEIHIFGNIQPIRFDASKTIFIECSIHFDDLFSFFDTTECMFFQIIFASRTHFLNFQTNEIGGGHRCSRTLNDWIVVFGSIRDRGQFAVRSRRVNEIKTRANKSTPKRWNHLDVSIALISNNSNVTIDINRYYTEVCFSFIAFAW